MNKFWVIVIFIALMVSRNVYSSDLIGVWRLDVIKDHGKASTELLYISATNDRYEAEFFGWTLGGRYTIHRGELVRSGSTFKISGKLGVLVQSSDKILMKGREYYRLSASETESFINTLNPSLETKTKNKKLCEEIQIEVDAKQRAGRRMSGVSWNNWVEEIINRMPPGCSIRG